MGCDLCCLTAFSVDSLRNTVPLAAGGFHSPYSFRKRWAIPSYVLAEPSSKFA